MVEANGGKTKVSSDSADELYGLWADDWNLGDMGRRFMSTASPMTDPTQEVPVTQNDIQYDPALVCNRPD